MSPTLELEMQLLVQDIKGVRMVTETHVQEGAVTNKKAINIPIAPSNSVKMIKDQSFT